MKNYTPFLTLLLALSAYTLFAQQWYPALVPHSRDIGTVAILDKNTIVVGAGSLISDQFEDFLKTYDYGQVYNVFSTGLNTSQVKSITFKGNMLGYAVHYKGKISKTVDGGNVWATVGLLNNKNLFKVICHGQQDWFIVGGTQTKDSALILKSGDNGSSWTSVYEQAGTWLKSICFADSLTGFAVGDSAQLLKTTDGGNTWTATASPISNRNFNAIYFLNATDGFIVGGLEDSIRTIIHTTDGGNSWSVLADAPGGGLNDITFATATDGYIVGDSAQLLKTTDAGANWTPQALPNTFPDLSLTAITFYQNELGVIGGRSGRLYLYTATDTPEVVLLPHTLANNGSVVLAAKVNTHQVPAKYTITVSDDSLFNAPSTQFASQVIAGDTFISVAEAFNGFTPGVTYYYFCYVKNIAGSVLSNTGSFVYNPGAYSFELGQFSGSPDSMVVSGTVANIPEPVSVYFDYSTDRTFSHHVAAMPALINDTAQHAVSAVLSGLPPYNWYYCRMRGEGQTRQYFSRVMTFATGNPATRFETLPVSSVTDSSAVLQGIVSGGKIPMVVYFDYGFDPIFMYNTVYATPSQISDSLTHSVSAPIARLLPDTLYYYRVRIKTENGEYQSLPLSFYTSAQPYLFQTLAPANVTGYSATLQGQVANLPASMSLHFEYGFNSFLGNSIQATPALVNDTLTHSATALLLGLAPYTDYYYRLVGQSAKGTFYGAITNFRTGNQSATFQTTAATNITTTSARLNGSAVQLSPGTSLSFEYGTTTAFGSSIVAVPPLINDTLQHTISADLQGLLPNTFYYFRLKAQPPSGPSLSGNTVSFYTGANPIPNWDFQYWHQDTALLASRWTFIGKEFERTAGHSGNYALKVSNTTIALLGKVADNTPFPFFMGVPFHQRPDSISVYLNYHLAAGDTGGMLLYLYDQANNNISYQLFPITGNSGGSFKRLTFPVSYNSPLMPDSIVLGFTCDFPDDNVSHLGDYLIIDDITPVPNLQPIRNGDFEEWYPFTAYLLDSWNYESLQLSVDATNQAGPMVTQAIFAQPDDYAAEIRNVNLGGMMIGGQITNVHDDPFAKEGGTPVYAKHQTFNGYYKWLPQGSDTMVIDIQMMHQGQNIGGGGIRQADPVAEFTPFSIPINYSVSGVTPDTVRITIRSYMQYPAGASKLTVDKLSFDGFTTGLREEPWVSDRDFRFKAYPNPVQDNLTVEWKEPAAASGRATLSLINLNGELVRTVQVDCATQKARLDIHDLDAGFYLLRIQAGQRMGYQKIIIGR